MTTTHSIFRGDAPGLVSPGKRAPHRRVPHRVERVRRERLGAGGRHHPRDSEARDVRALMGAGQPHRATQSSPWPSLIESPPPCSTFRPMSPHQVSR
jgi:hypothetical protein